MKLFNITLNTEQQIKLDTMTIVGTFTKHIQYVRSLINSRVK